MFFSVIICTYMRAKAISNLLESIKKQTLYPNEILIIDASLNNETKAVFEQLNLENAKYFMVDDENRGLTKQRNFGVKHRHQNSEVVCFLDDDTVLEKDYFENVINTFKNDKEVVGVGGVAINENRWKPKQPNLKYSNFFYYEFEGNIYKEGIRNVVRNFLGLASNLGPGRMPLFSHGRNCGFPLTGKTYEVDLLIGMSMSFKAFVFNSIQFSSFFEGYGLYEDADFSIRAQKFGKNVINTKAQLSHYHDAAGRPNQFKYGKMVVRNGWYVWRVKNPNPKSKDIFKWYAITLLLTMIRFTNVITTTKRKEALTEATGRTVGMFHVLFK